MSLKRFAKDTAIYGIATVLPRVINILLLRLFTDEMKTAQFSDATYFWIFASFFNVILTYGMETAFFRFFTKLNEDKKVINTAFTSILISSFIFLSIILLFRNNIAGILDFNVKYFTIMVWVTILDTLIVIPYAFLRVTNRPVRFAFYKISNIFLYVLAIIFFFKLLPYLTNYNSNFGAFFQNNNNAVYIFYSTLFASAMTFLLFLPVIKKFKLSIDKNIWFKMLKYGLPIMIAGIAYIINENLDKYLLRRMISPDVMGAYAATYKIGVFMTLYITAFRLGAEPFFFSHSKEHDAKQKYAKILLWFTIVGSVFYVFIVSYMDLISSFFIRKPEYFITISIVPIILIANLMLGIYYNLTIWYKLTDRTKFGMYLSILGAIITITINIVLIPIYGFMASAWATLIAYSTMTVVSYLLGRKYYKVPYNLGKIIFYLVLSSIFSFVIFNYFYNDLIIKTGIFLIFIATVLILEKKELIQIIKS
jgi:O-antigen/teichoic acid export membrane protein